MAIPIAQDFNKRISFQNALPPFNAATGVSSNRTTVLTVRASVEEDGGGLDVAHRKSKTQTTEYQIWTQYRSEITGFQQILWGSKVLIQTTAPQKVPIGGGRYFLSIRAQYVIEKAL